MSEDLFVRRHARDRIVYQSNVDIKNPPKLRPEYLSTTPVHYDFKRYGVDEHLNDFEMEVKFLLMVIPLGQAEDHWDTLKVRDMTFSPMNIYYEIREINENIS